MCQIKLQAQINNTSSFAIRTNAEWNGETEKERRMPVPGLDTKLIATVVRLSVHFLSYDEGVACLWIPQAKTCAETHRSDPGSDGPVDFR